MATSTKGASTEARDVRTPARDRYITCAVKINGAENGRTEILDTMTDGGEGEPLIVASFFDRNTAEMFCRAANALPDRFGGSPFDPSKLDDAGRDKAAETAALSGRTVTVHRHDLSGMTPAQIREDTAVGETKFDPKLAAQQMRARMSVRASNELSGGMGGLIESARLAPPMPTAAQERAAADLRGEAEEAPRIEAAEAEAAASILLRAYGEWKDHKFPLCHESRSDYEKVLMRAGPALAHYVLATRPPLPRPAAQVDPRAIDIARDQLLNAIAQAAKSRTPYDIGRASGMVSTLYLLELMPEDEWRRHMGYLNDLCAPEPARAVNAASIDRTAPTPDTCAVCGAELGPWEPVLTKDGNAVPGQWQRICYGATTHTERHERRPDPDLEYDASLDQQRRTEAATRAALGGTFRDPSLERDRQPIGRHTDVSA